MLTIKVCCVFVCLVYKVLSESTEVADNGTSNLSSIDIQSELRKLMNYPIFDSTNFQDFEDDYVYYRCGLKGIKAFKETPTFTSSKYQSLCRIIENREFIKYKDKCGAGNLELTETPWLVSVMIRNFSGNGDVLYRATGSILHPNIILVPQEPFEPYKNQKLMIRANGQTQNLVIDNTNTQTREVVQILAENFTPIKFQQLKKSLLVLAEPILFNTDAQSICLPDSDLQYERNHCYVLGWNRSNRLVKSLTSLIECKDFQYYHGTSVLKEFFVCTDQIIVEPFKRDANYCRQNQICDFSTVLVCAAAGQKFFYQVGVGYMIANDRAYFLSTIASKSWIDQTIYNLQFKSQYYTRDTNNTKESPHST